MKYFCFIFSFCLSVYANLEIEVLSKDVTLPSKAWEVPIEVEVRNSSNRKTEVIVANCVAANWSTPSFRVGPEATYSCARATKTYSLEPGKSFVRKVSIGRKTDTKAGKHSVTLGFRPSTSKKDRRPDNSSKPYLSKPFTVTVVAMPPPN